MKTVYAKNPAWSSAEHIGVNLDVLFEEFGYEIPFHATPFDTLAHGVDLYNRAISGEFGTIAEYVEPAELPVEYGPEWDAATEQLQPTVEGAQEL